MQGQRLRSAVRRLRHVVLSPPAGPDAELLCAFAGRRDGRAFEQLVRRHGPMVLGVCRRALRDPADADDAFQAVFLVLVRKAGSLRQPDRLAGWLHQVAHRTAKKLRAVRLARARREGELFDVPAGEPPAEVVWRELRPVFDAELDRLPDRLRLPAVLCLLEGHSKADAARALGWPEGTVSCRLQRARERLRARLSARGLTLSAGALAAALFEGAGSAAVPDRLIATTLHGVLSPAAAAGVRALADGVTQAMFLTKLKAVAAAALVAGVVGTGTGVALVPGSGPGPVAAGEPAKGPVPREVSPTDPNALADRIELARVRTTALDTQMKSAQDRAEESRRELHQLLRRRLDDLRTKAERLQPLVVKGTYPVAEWNELQRSILSTEAELKKLSPRADPADPDRAIQNQELELLKERLAFEERMVRKGFMTEAQVKKTRLEVARAEAALAKAEAPKPPDPRRQAMEATIRKLEEIVEQTRQGVQCGIIPQAELLNSEATLARYKFELLTLDDRRPTPAAPPTAEQRAALEAIVKKLEEIAAQAEEGAKKGIIPQQELLNTQLKVLEYKFKLAELGAAAEPRAAEASPLTQLEAEATVKAKELERAEALRKQNAISEGEVRRLRVEVNRLRARAAAGGGDYPRAARYHEAVMADLEAQVADTKVLVERKAVSRSELRAAEVALAEAKVDAHRFAIRRQLAAIARARDEELREARALYESKAISTEDLGRAERAATEASARLAAER